jgi:hypothetical protein
MAPAAKAGAHKSRMFVHSEEYELSGRCALNELPNRIDTVHERHRNVDDDYIRLQRFRLREKFVPVLDGSDDIKIGL